MLQYIKDTFYFRHAAINWGVCVLLIGRKYWQKKSSLSFFLFFFFIIHLIIESTYSPMLLLLLYVYLIYTYFYLIIVYFICIFIIIIVFIQKQKKSNVCLHLSKLVWWIRSQRALPRNVLHTNRTNISWYKYVFYNTVSLVCLC